jgi:hypothetical protein
MEQSVTAANARAEAFKNRTISLETELFRARVSRVELETDVSHVRWNTYNWATAYFFPQYRKVIDDGKKAFAELSTDLRKLQEALSVANLAIERQRKAGESKPVPSSQKEAQLQKEVDKCMVSAKRDSVAGRARPDLSIHRASSSVQRVGRTCARQYSRSVCIVRFSRIL